jgi:hypothetical protein
LFSFTVFGFYNWSLVSHHELLSNPIQNKIISLIGLRMAMVAIGAGVVRAGAEQGRQSRKFMRKRRRNETDADQAFIISLSYANCKLPGKKSMRSSD